MRTRLLGSVAGAALLVGSGALAQTTTTPASPPAKPGNTAATDTKSPAATADTKKTASAAKMTLSEQQAKSWIDKPVYSSDGKEIGEIVEFKRGTGDVVQEMHADIGGMLGMGEARVKLTPDQFKLQNDRAVLNLTQEQAKTLPKVQG
jgi:hypothetical protein